MYGQARSNVALGFAALDRYGDEKIYYLRPNLLYTIIRVGTFTSSSVS